MLTFHSRKKDSKAIFKIFSKIQCSKYLTSTLLDAKTWSPDLRVSKTALMAAMPTKKIKKIMINSCLLAIFFPRPYAVASLLYSLRYRYDIEKRDFVTFWHIFGEFWLLVCVMKNSGRATSKKTLAVSVHSAPTEF